MITAGKIGTWLSGICCVHCMAMPLLIAFLPSLGIGFLASEKVEISFILGAILISVLGLCWGYKRHRKVKPFFVLTAGILLFFFGHHIEVSTFWKVIFPLFAGICFAAANFINHKLCRTCHECTDH